MVEQKKTICKRTMHYFSILRERYKNGFPEEFSKFIKSEYVFKILNRENFKYEEIYNITIDKENKILEANFSSDEEELPYHISSHEIEVSLYYAQIHEEDEDEEEQQPFVSAIKEELCCICYVNEPNIFYSDCRHFSTCSICEESTTLNKCPLCRTQVTKPKIKI